MPAGMVTARSRDTAWFYDRVQKLPLFGRNDTR